VPARAVLGLLSWINPEMILGGVNMDLISRDDDVKKALASDSLRWSSGCKVNFFWWWWWWWGRSATSCASPLRPSIFSDYSFSCPPPGMTGISLHMQWPLTSQSHGSFLKEKNWFLLLRIKLHAPRFNI
jgi:hypothetical protein